MQAHPHPHATLRSGTYKSLPLAERMECPSGTCERHAQQHAVSIPWCTQTDNLAADMGYSMPRTHRHKHHQHQHRDMQQDNHHCHSHSHGPPHTYIHCTLECRSCVVEGVDRSICGGHACQTEHATPRPVVSSSRAGIAGAGHQTRPPPRLHTQRTLLCTAHCLPRHTPP